MDNIQSTRTRLHSFITYPLKNVTSRQRDAVQKMLFLEEDQFQELLMDIQDEIARRECRQKEPLPKSDAYTTKRNKSRQNLARLNSGKFENLVIDVLLVLNHRFPDLEEKNVTEIETLIGDLEKLITDLKGDMAYEQLVIEQVGSEKDLKLRLHIYNKYVRRMLEKHNEDVSVVQFVDEILKCQADCTSVSMFDLMDTNVFLKQCEVFFKKMNMYSEEYDYHRGNLITLVDEKIFSVDVHEKLVRKEKKSLFELMLKVDKKSKKGDRSIEREVNTIITSLSTIKDLYKSGEDDEYFTVAKNVADAIDNLIKKLDGVDNVDTDQVNELVGTREELIKLIKERNGECIPMTIFNMARLVKNILYCIPVTSLK